MNHTVLKKFLKVQELELCIFRNAHLVSTRKTGGSTPLEGQGLSLQHEKDKGQQSTLLWRTGLA